MRPTPVATYRLQLHSGFGFDDAAAIADYLKSLGVSHVYSSPNLQSTPGSKHGYDVVDFHKANEELGGEDGHKRLCAHLKKCGLGQVLDIVPNHMAINGKLNLCWWDVLENGPASLYADYFDIDWETREEKLRNKVLVPMLGEHYGKVLDKGQLKLMREDSEFVVNYFENQFPTSPRSRRMILDAAALESGSQQLAFLANSLKTLPGPTGTDEDSRTERHRNQQVINDLLTKLFNEDPLAAEAVDRTVRQINEDADKMDEFLEEQNYKLAHWETSRQELPYRRFFDVNTLVGLRVEKPEVFEDTHALILKWVKDGLLDGLRVDHPDGLRDPKQYFERLRQKAPDVWIVGEKILEPGERLRKDWPVNGTVGYDYLNQVGGLFVDSANEAEFNRIYNDFTGESTDYSQVCRDKKHLVLRDLLGSEVNRLTSLLTDIFQLHRSQRDYMRSDATNAICELVACFSVYRSYVVPERGEITEEDKRYIDEATELAKKNRPEVDASLFDFIRSLMLLEVTGDLEAEFVMRFQQFTGPSMAKGVEDTVFYCYNRLMALNEVGGDPGRFGVSVEEFHKFNCAAYRSHPSTMLASSTHDTKRSEDVRARICLLSEMPDEWEKTLKEWKSLNNHSDFDSNTEYLIYQTLVGAWPLEKERLLLYLEKATREAKQKTSWLASNGEFEAATKQFVDEMYSNAAFIKSLGGACGEADVARAHEFPGGDANETDVAWRARYISGFRSLGSESG